MTDLRNLKGCRSCAQLLLIFVILLISCNTSPTVPLPPPEAIEVTAPDEYGYVWVRGESDYGEGDIATVFNQNTDAGSMSAVENDGTFEIAIEAEIGDTLVIQILHNGKLSDEAVEVVPSGS